MSVVRPLVDDQTSDRDRVLVEVFPVGLRTNDDDWRGNEHWQVPRAGSQRDISVAFIAHRVEKDTVAWL